MVCKGRTEAILPRELKEEREKKNERRPNLFPTDPTTQSISQVFLIISYAFVYFYK